MTVIFHRAGWGALLAACLTTAWGANAPAPASRASNTGPAPAGSKAPANSAAATTGAAPSANVAVLSAEQVIQILDQTVDWYRTLGVQQQSSSQPSDLLIVYANQQTANEVVALAFDLARANAELLSSAATAPPSTGSEPQSANALDALRDKLTTQGAGLQAEIRDARVQLNQAHGKGESEAKVSELQSELDMINARINLLETMTQFVSEKNAKTASVNALKAQIDAIADSIPAAGVATAPAAAPTAARATASASAASKNAKPPAPTLLTGGTGAVRVGLWGLGAQVLALHDKGSTIEAIDRRTVDLEKTFLKIRGPPLERLKALSAQSDALATQADSAHGAELKAVRDQLDTLAWLFQQTSAILIPLSKEEVLLEQYRHNLKNWRDAVRNQYDAALEALGIRVAILIGLLALVFAGGEVWRRLVVRYVAEPRRRYQLLFVQKLTLWTVVVAIIAVTFVTELSAFATFAGLITAGLAVAMQSVLVSIVGYFFLIGKYGLRVGDRVQIGAVTGEVINLGLVRMHLMELNPQGPLGPTGRVVAFANSIVFQATSGLFRQIPGVNFVWHETALSLPAGSDYAALKQKLLAAVRAVIGEHHEEIVRQTRQIEQTTASTAVGDARAQVLLRFSASGAEALVRYPVQPQHEADVDERVSQELFKVIAEA
ncbi:MAG TPA: hypothetical protein VIX87_01965 [Steroidobacteraceae bacterium]